MKNWKHGAFAVLIATLAIGALAFTALSLAACEQPADSPKVTLTGITAAYTGTATIYPTTPLDDLKAGLTVTAQYSNNTRKTLNAADYSLSGTLSVGTRTVTVNYEGKKTTFTVTVTASSDNPGNGDITYSVIQSGGVDGETDSAGIVFAFSGSVDSLDLSADDITVGGTAEKDVDARLSGSGTSRTLAITVSAAGTATVTITKDGIEAGTKYVTVYKAGETAPTLTGITAVYNGTTTVYPDTPLNNLKANLIVTAQYSDNSNETLDSADYALSGTLAEGDSVITVSYQGKTTTFTVTVIAAHNHNWGNWTQTTAPTCTTAGIKTRTCDTPPSHTETRAGAAALGHDYQNWTQTTAPTCTTAGVETGTCTHDATHITTRAGAAALGHDYQNWTQTTPPTCTTAGVETGTCTHDPTHKDTRAVAIVPTAHNWNNNYTVTTPANCTTTGIETDTCSYNATHTRTQTIAVNPNAHNYQLLSTATVTEDGVEGMICTHNPTHTQGETTIAYATGTAGLVFELIDSGNNVGTYRVSRGTVYSGAVHIPAYHRPDADSPYLPVTEFGNQAFISSDITAVTFAANSQLESIGQQAFYYCTSLTNITIPASVTAIGDMAFSGCRSLTSITIPASVTTIGNTAFWNCTGLASVTIGTGVKSIGNYAFRDCTGLTSITIPENITYVSNYAFSGCTNLRNIIIDTDNNADGGYTWAGIFLADNLSVTFKKNVVNNAFMDCTRLTSVTIAEGVTSIGQQAFRSCTGLTNITISASVTSIGTNALLGLTNAQTIYVDGYNSQSAADAAWGSAWRTNCYAVIVYAAVALDITITTTQEWNNALTLLNGKRGTAALTIGDSFSIAGTTANTFGTTANGTTLAVTLKGSGTVSLSSDGSMIRLADNQTLIIDSENLTLQGRMNTASLVYVNGSTAKLELRNGTIRDNNLSSASYGSTQANGGGVYVGSGNFIMSGGTISGNTASASSINDSAKAYGGGVYVRSGGNFTMTGGTISNNRASASGHPNYTCQACGGGVYVESGGTFRIVNGTIYGNSESTTSLRNTVNVSGFYDSIASGAALYGSAQRGTFSGTTWNSSGSLSTTDNTIRVVNGALE